MSDERDPKVSQRYRELGAEEPSRELDQTILAAAHRAAARPHAPLVTPAGRHRWYFALGAAAVLMLAVAVTVHMERRQPDFEALPPAPATTEQRRATEEPRREESTIGSGARSDTPRAAPAPKPAAPPQPSEAKPQPRVMVDEAQGDPAPTQGTQESAAQKPGRDVAPAAGRISPTMVEPPERWLERVVQLRKEGKHEEADRQLAEFRKRYPDYKVPEAALR